MIFGEQHQKAIEWDSLSGAYEQQYTAIQNGENAEKLPDVEDIYLIALGIIESHHHKDKFLLR